ncbi:PQQ-binding-like beta-propeller repeat protein, partial [Streptomyces sp. SR27]|uniref:outer membrane protein assembly factor BamB family protein n=1 Tax=Streptomyces sp. SR27 TaxID=3076630 RepID=UPI00295B1297
AAALGLAGAGGGVWAWLGSREDGGATGGSGSAAGPTAIPATTASDGAPAALWRGESLDREESITPLLAGGVVGFAETVSFRALDPRNGAKVWADSMVMEPHQITTDGTRFYTSDDPVDRSAALLIRTLDPRTGKEAARTITLKKFEGSSFGTELLTAASGFLYAASRIGTRDDSMEQRETGWYLLAVDLRTGKEAWRRPIAWGNVRPWLSQIVGDRMVLAKNSDDLLSFDIQARELRTGRQLWRRSVPLKESQSYRPGQLSTDDRHLYLGGDRLRALRLTDGGVAWEYGGGSVYGLPAVSGGLVHANEAGRGLVVVSADKGAKRWEEASSGRSLTPDLYTVPVVGTKYVYTPVRGGLSAVDRVTHRSAWVFPTDATRFVVDTSRTRIVGAGATSVVALPLA